MSSSWHRPGENTGRTVFAISTRFEILKTGLLIGAGFSKDFGLPLVTEVTNTLKTWLTPEKFWSIENAARARGDGYSEEIAQEILSILERDEMHFEAILGYFQVQEIRSRADQKTAQTYASLYAWFARLISEIIWGEPAKTLWSFRGVVPEYQQGLRILVQQNRPLWVFSLNYDLVVECLAAKLGIPIESGLPDKGSFVIRHTDGRAIGRLPTEVISGDQLEKPGLTFSTANHSCSWGEHEAFYLIKIHRGLDMFTIHDGKDLIKIATVGPTDAHIIGNLITPALVQMAEETHSHVLLHGSMSSNPGYLLLIATTSLHKDSGQADPRHVNVLLTKLLKSAAVNGKRW